MKNIATCYSEHAIKVSDSYCSGPSNQLASNYSPLPATNSTRKTAITSIYKVKLSNEKQFHVRVSWCHQNNPLNQAFSVCVSDSAAKLSRNFKILRRQRGSESFESGGVRADVFWDLRRARYEAGPEPVSGFYVAVLVNSELSLMLGDMGQEFEVKKCISDSDIKAAEYSLISRGERFSGDGEYSTRAKFSEAGTWHDILIKFSGEEGGKKNPFLCVYVDKKSVIEAKRLQWNFRGNQSIFLDGLLVDLMWDVHDWLYNPTSGHAVFLFRTRRGLDSRLWLEDDTNFDQQKLSFSFLIFALKNPD